MQKSQNNTSGVLLISREERSTTVQHKIEERKDRYREEIEKGIEKRVLKIYQNLYSNTINT